MTTLTSIDDVATFKIRNVSPEFDFFFFGSIRIENGRCVSDVTTRDCLHKARSPPIDHAKPTTTQHSFHPSLVVSCLV